MQQAGPVPLLERVQALTSLEYRPVDRGEEIYLVIGVSMQEGKNPIVVPNEFDKVINEVAGAVLGFLDGLTGGVSTSIVNWAGGRLIGEEFAEMMAVFQATDGWQIGSKFGTGAAIALSFTPCGMGWLTVARRALDAVQAAVAIADLQAADDGHRRPRTAGECPHRPLMWQRRRRRQVRLRTKRCVGEVVPGLAALSLTGRKDDQGLGPRHLAGI